MTDSLTSYTKTCVAKANIQGQTVSIYRKSHGYAITIERSTVYTFDLTGRLLWVYRNGKNYQRGLDHRILIKWREGTQLRREYMPEPGELYQTVFPEIESILPEFQGEARQILQTILAKSPDSLATEGQRFHEIYRPISILPPDQYTAIVLQAAEGCSYNRCSFCNFYKGRSFRIKSLAEFEAHVRDVRDFLGEGLAFRRSVFLADGDALMIPQALLLNMITVIRDIFPPYPLYSFMDAFRPQAKTEADYRELSGQGLDRVYVGLETGNAELLKFLNKPGTPGLMQDEVLKMKRAGLNVGVIVMVGVGGDVFAEAHVRDTIACLNAMKLGPGDMIYFSEFVVHPEQPYAIAAREKGIQFLSEKAMKAQYRSIRAGLIFENGHPRMAPYHIREFLY